MYNRSLVILYQKGAQMANKDIVPVLFEEHKIRRKIVDGVVYYSLVDIIAAITGSTSPSKLWVWTKNALKTDGIELSSITRRLKLTASDGKKYFTDCAEGKNVILIIEYLRSPKAAPFKVWFAKLTAERIEEIENPSKGVENSIRRWKQMGKSDPWIAERVKGIGIRNAETDVLKAHGISAPKDFAHFTDRTNVAVYGHTAKVEKAIRKVPARANLRDASSMTELALLGFHESACSMGIGKRDAQGKVEIDGVYDVVSGIVSTAKQSLLAAFGGSIAPDAAD